MINKKLKLVTFGRACIDLNAVEYNRPMEETHTFAKYVGGSPANIAIGTAKLGIKVGFIGKISQDQHGNFIKSYMKDVGVDVNHMIFDNEGRKVGLAFTEIKSPTECSILMYRDNVADLYIKPEEVDEEYIKNTEYLLISGTSLAKSPSREAAFKAVSYAKKNGVRVIFELDYRPYTWKSEIETSIYYSLLAEQCDIVIGTRDEYDVLENKKGEDQKTVDYLFKYSPSIVVIKHGVEGSYAFTKQDNKKYYGKIYKTNVLKTFGAGDSYASGFLYAYFNGKDMETALKYGSAAASIVVSKHSSSEAMPDVQAIEKLINEQQ